MRRGLLLLAALAALLPASAGAITNGQQDAGSYPMVGALVGTFDGVTYPYCSGVLISPTVFLTAAHCDPGDQPACVTFDEVYTSSSPLVCGQWYAYPTFSGHGEGEPNDVAVVVFSEPVGITPATIAPLDFLDTLKSQHALKDATFTSVGYGAFAPVNGPGGKTYTYPDARYFSVGTYNSLGPAYLHLSQNPTLGNGGTCYGDSGGPVFYDSTTTVVAIVSTGDAVCRSTNVAQRVDTPSVQAFLAQFLAS